MTSAVEDFVAPERVDGAAPPRFALLRAKLAVLAATAGKPIGAAEDEAVNECEILPVVDEGQLAGMRAEMTGPCFANFLFCYLLDVEFHLEDIARARRANDFPRLARNADTLAGAAADVGALRASAAARRLDDACRAGHYRQSGALIHALGQSCTEAEMELRGFLAAQTRQQQGWR